MLRRLLWAGVLLAACAAVVLAYAFAEARRDPEVRRATVELPDWPAGAAPVRAVLLSDIHIGSPAMDAARLSRIIAQVNALRPDIVLIAGDFVYGHDPAGAARWAPGLVTPLKELRARLGTVAVLGNHDWWTGPEAVIAALRAAGVTVAENRVVRRGPLAIAVFGDTYTGHHRIGPVLAELRKARGAQIALTHGPELSGMLRAGPPLVLAGHSHCGQVVILGHAVGVQPYPPRYRCGIVRERARATIVTGGVGTSVAPIRLGAPPDLWLLTLRGVNLSRS